MSNLNRGYRVHFNAQEDFNGLIELTALTGWATLPADAMFDIGIGNSSANVYIVDSGSSDTGSALRYATGTYTTKGPFDSKEPPALYSDAATGAGCWITILVRA